MVDISVRVEIDDVVLERGGRAIGTVVLSEITGDKWSAAKLRRLAAACQAKADHRRLIADLEDIDPDKIHALAGDDTWFTDTYGGRMFIDGDSVVSRSDLITFTLVNGDLYPHVEALL